MQRIALSGKNGKGKYVLLDDDDYVWAAHFKWHAKKGGYPARRNGPNTHIFLHNELVSPPSGLLVDHKDGDVLNATRSNLRLCTKSQNQWNRRRFGMERKGRIGVFWDTSRSMWSAQLRMYDSIIHIGRFDDEHEAMYVYDQFTIQLRGQFAVLNIPFD
jgi:hypothetical protein